MANIYVYCITICHSAPHSVIVAIISGRVSIIKNLLIPKTRTLNHKDFIVRMLYKDVLGLVAEQ